jgi:hypothetical protein
VTYVPETVREEISNAIRSQLRDEVKRDLITQAREERWGVPGALPNWVDDLTFFGDVRVRAEADNYAKDNATNSYLNLNAVNAAGGIDRAGLNAFFNTTTDRRLMFGRLRFGLDARLGGDFTLDLRAASGSASPVSANQVLGTYGERWFFGVDRAALLWNPFSASGMQELDVRVGRFANPFVTYNELVWDVDLDFEGISATYALDLFREKGETRPGRSLFVTAGAFPLQSLGQYQGAAISPINSKWLYGGQLGGELPYGEQQKLRLSAAYYDFVHITGVQNPPDGTIDNFTAPVYLWRANTVYDISNSSDSTVNLFALAGKYREADANLLWDLAGFGANRVVLGADLVKNLAWSERDVLQRTGQLIKARTVGWEVGLDVGHSTLTARGQWRAFLSYRTVQRDAVVDAFDDSDFHLGGTDARGYIVGFDVGLSKAVGLRLKYQAANAIDGPPLSIDVLQLEVNGRY